MLIAGRKHYVFSKPNEMAAVFRNQKTLDGGSFVRMLNTKWFDFSNRDADTYTSLPKSLDADLETIIDGSINEELLHFITSTQGVASTSAYYGKTLLERNPNIVADVITFKSKGHWTLLFGVPKMFYPEPHIRRERILASLKSIIYPDGPVSDGPSPFITLLAKELEASGMGREGVVSEMFSIFFG